MQPKESKTNWHFQIRGELLIAGTLLILAEVLGIAEEL